MGWPNAAAGTQRLLEAYSPRFITTFGVLGGRAQDVKKAIFFTAAKIHDAGKLIELKPLVGNEHRNPVKVWRSHEAEAKLVRPSKNGPTYVYTSKESVPTDDPKALEKTLAETGVFGLDMEIGSIWCSLNEHNHRFAKEPTKQCMALAAVKAVSDAGGGADRDANLADALDNAFLAMKEYLEYLLRNNCV